MNFSDSHASGSTAQVIQGFRYNGSSASGWGWARNISNPTYRWSVDGITIQTGTTIPSIVRWVTLDSFEYSASAIRWVTYYDIDGPYEEMITDFAGSRIIENSTFRWSVDGTTVQSGNASQIPANARWVTLSSFHYRGSTVAQPNNVAGWSSDTRAIESPNFHWSLDGTTVQSGNASQIPANAKWVTLESYSYRGSSIGQDGTALWTPSTETIYNVTMKTVGIFSNIVPTITVSTPVNNGYLSKILNLA